MYVKNRMTKNPVCIDINSKISDVVDIMNERELHRLPVVSGKKLVGLVTESMISKNGASKATSLSIYELNYLLSKTSVDAIMIRDVITIHEDRFLEDAALLMFKHDIGCLPVI
ncbi:MAG: CBS domain-containing protein, partial [Longicatena sp.]